MSMKRKLLPSLAFLSICIMAGCGQNSGYLITPVPLNQRLEETTIQKDPGLLVYDKIVIVDVDGLLMNVQEHSLFGYGENPVSLFVEKIDKAQADPDVKAVIIRINSPGGGVTASDIMYHRLVQFRQARQVPVVAIVEDVGASGGYYVACGSDRIMAHPTAITGSIGVIVQMVSLADTMKMVGVETKAVTSGKFKSMGSPFKPLEKDDVVLVQGLVNDYYESFLKVVQSGRPKLSADKIRTLADGRVYSGKQALDNGLVDQLGYMSDSISQAKTMSGSSKVKVVIYHRPIGYKANAYSEAPVPSPAAATQINMVNISVPELMEFSRPQFLYLWSGQASH